jgi:hypothetical protein
VAYGERAAHKLESLAWPHSGAPLLRVAVNAETTGLDREFSDRSAGFTQTYGITGDTLLLIRPDGYLASIATHDILAVTQSAVRSLTPVQTPAAKESRP